MRIPDMGDRLYLFYFVPIYNLFSGNYAYGMEVIMVCDMTEIQRYILESSNSEALQATLNCEDTPICSFGPAQSRIEQSDTESLISQIAIPSTNGKDWRFTCSIPKSTVWKQVLSICLPLMIPYLLSILIVVFLLSRMYRTLYRNVSGIVSDINTLNVSIKILLRIMFEIRRSRSFRVFPNPSITW